MTGGWQSWSGIIAAPIAWAAHQQIVSNMNYGDCATGDGALAAFVGILALLVVGLAASLSFQGWKAHAPAGGLSNPAARLIGALSLMLCGLMGLTILVQILAGAMVPACAR
jgi:hypothetical protein